MTTSAELLLFLFRDVQIGPETMIRVTPKLFVIIINDFKQNINKNTHDLTVCSFVTQ